MPFIAAAIFWAAFVNEAGRPANKSDDAWDYFPLMGSIVGFFACLLWGFS